MRNMKAVRHADSIAGTNIIALQSLSESLPQFIERCESLERGEQGVPAVEPIELEDQPA